MKELQWMQLINYGVDYAINTPIFQQHRYLLMKESEIG